MSKIVLVYDNEEYSILNNGNIELTTKDSDDAMTAFKALVSKTKAPELNSWDSIEAEMKNYINTGVEINSEFKNLTYGPMKYFHTNGKVFIFENGQMIPLMGGYTFFHFVVTIASKGDMDICNKVLDLAKTILIANAIYRVKDTSLTISSPRFNYGTCEFNFTSNKIHKGATVASGSFEEFIQYINSILK